jgi:hypothetical protein
MKNKRLLYLLVPAVLLIWGIIFYQVQETLMGADTEEPPDRGLPQRKKEAVATPDTVILLANYRDPFLAGTHRTQQLPQSTRVMTKKEPLAPVQHPVAVPRSGLACTGVSGND